MHSNQNMVSPSFPRSIYGLPTFSTKKGIGCTSGQNLLAPSHQCNHGPTWIALSFFAFYNCLCYHASTKISISGGICYIAIKYLALSYGFWILSFGIKSQNWEYWCSSISIYPWVYPWAYILEYEYISLSIYPCVWVYILECEYISLSISLSIYPWVWVYILEYEYISLSMSIYPFGLFSGHWATLLTEADQESVSLLFVCPTICLCSRRENNSTINYASLSGRSPNKFCKPKFWTLTPHI